MAQDIRPSYPLFDWLRFVLASLVFMEHAQIVGGMLPGYFAVQVFFALSGWLIGGILINMQASDLPRFFFNRATRIWIPYFFAVFLLYSFALLKEGVAPYYFRSLLSDVTLTHNWFIKKVPEVLSAMPMQGTGAHFWSIAVEEQFYLVAPILIFFTPVRKSVVAWTALTAIAILSGSLFGAISGGVLAVILNQRWPNFYSGKAAQIGIFTALLVMVAASWIWPQSYSYLLPLISVAIVLLLVRPGPRGALGMTLGGLSFPMYLNHWIGIFAGNALLSKVPAIGKSGAMGVGYGFAVISAAGIYWLIDRNVMRYRDAWYTALRGKGAMTVAYSLLIVGVIMGAFVLGPINSAPMRKMDQISAVASVHLIMLDALKGDLDHAQTSGPTTVE